MTVLLPVLDSHMYGIDQRFDRNTVSLTTAVGQMFKFGLYKNDIKLLSTYFDISEDELKTNSFTLIVEHRLCGTNG